MKIAIATDDGKTISRHFGRAKYYLVLTIEAGAVTGQELREKPAHNHGHHGHHEPHELHLHDHSPEPGESPADTHGQMLDPIRDCAAAIARGMGAGAYVSIQNAGLRPFLTEFEQAEAAVQAYIDGTLVDHQERLH